MLVYFVTLGMLFYAFINIILRKCLQASADFQWALGQSLLSGSAGALPEGGHRHQPGKLFPTSLICRPNNGHEKQTVSVDRS
jgi:hypothetical protein